jgi:lysophospholipase L1-like esterase
MKYLIFIMAGIFLASCHSTIEESKVMDLSSKRILFLGDSITQAGHYVGFLEYALRKQNPEQGFDFYSLGLNSETASGLSENDHPFPRPCVHSRLDSALDKIKPDVVFVCYGMNDGIYHPLNEKILDAYQQGILGLVEKCQDMNAQVIVITPPAFQAYAIRDDLREANAVGFSYRAPYKDYQKTLEAFSKWLRMAMSQDVICVSLNSSMMNYINDQRKENESFCFSKDGIHPSLEGHLFMAQITLDSLGINSSFLSQENLIAIKKDPLYKLVEKRRQVRARGWLKYVGYDRGKVFKTDSVQETESRASDLLEKIDAIN